MNAKLFEKTTGTVTVSYTKSPVTNTVTSGSVRLSIPLSSDGVNYNFGMPKGFVFPDEKENKESYKNDIKKYKSKYILFVQRYFPTYFQKFLKKDSDGNYIWNKKEIDNFVVTVNPPTEVYDLKDETQRLRVCIILASDMIATDDMFDPARNNRLQLVDEQQEAEESGVEFSKLAEAIKLFMALPKDQKESLAIALGADINATEEIKVALIQENIKKSPEDVITKIKNSGLTNIMATVYKAIDKKTITHDSFGYKYGDNILGVTKQEVVSYLSKEENQQLLKAISK